MIRTAEEVHAVSLKLLQEVDRICKKNNIPYYLCAGTLLGAVRHHNFIPWDDDVDIQMFRKDFERFAQICERDLHKDFAFYNPLEDTNYFVDFIPVILYKRSRLYKEDIQVDVHNHINLDIYIVDNTYDRKWRHRLHIWMLGLIYGLAMGHKKNFNIQKYKGIYKLFVPLMCFLGKKIKLETIVKWYTNVSAKLNKKTTKHVTPTNSPPPYMSPKYWYSRISYEMTELEIAGKKFPAPAGWEELLTLNYDGKYLELPPEEERIFKHVRMDEGEIW